MKRLLPSSPPKYHRGWLKRYDRLGPHDAAILEAEMAAFRSMMDSLVGQDERSSNYLDLGTCTGRYLRWACDKGLGAIFGVDSSPAAIAHCASLRLPDRVRLYRADFLREPILRELAVTHGQFHLITAMLGTIDHVRPVDQGGFMVSLRDALTPAGTLVLSGWRSGRCDLSLYSESERQFLESTSFRTMLSNKDHLPNDLRLTRTLVTEWHTLTMFTRDTITKEVSPGNRERPTAR